MAGSKIFILLATICFTYAEVKLITEPKPGQEYVFLQTSGAGSRPIERKEKVTESERVFETAHKLPPSVTYALNKAAAEEAAAKPAKPSKQKVKREALPADRPAPAPAGAIRLDPLKLIEMYKTELKTSTTEAPRKTSRRTTKTPKRSKKDIHEAHAAATSPRPVLTTGASAAKVVDDDVPLVASGSEKQRSRIQIKKGPNGQEYEYEYVYYYYDDEDEKKDSKKDAKKDSKKDSKVSNAHDGPARNEVTPKTSRGRGTTASPEPAVNEVLPTSRGRSRGRQLNEEETVGEERLPANTRFPPRSRNLGTTPLPEDEEETKPTRSRNRGKPSNDVAPETDSVSDETQGSRGRTRANVRRPSLELVDSASFNTHSSGNEPPNGSGPSFPSDLPAGPVRFLGATPNEQSELPDDAEDNAADKSPADDTDEDGVKITSTDSAGDDTTTMMSPMDKVALDLYAILQGTQRLSGEEEVNTELDATSATDTETTTLEITTEEITTEPTTPSTTTTTTTTTTEAPTTTTTTAAPEPAFGRGRYRNRVGGKKSTQSTSTTETPQDSKPKGKFERPKFGRPRPGGRTTAAPSDDEEPKIQKEESKPVSGGRNRNRFGAPRTRTTAAPSEASNDDSSASSAAPARPSLRPRPTFNLRTRTRTTAAPSDEESPASEDSAPSSTTARSRPRISGASGSVRPLRPGPRINLAARGRPGATTPSTEAPAETSAPAEEDEAPKAEENEEKEAEASPAPDTNPLNRLRNRQRPQIQVKPKAAASAPVQVRRVNPLLARRKPGAAEPTSEAPAESPSTEAAEEDEETDAPAASSSSTTEEPRGLNKLLAGRRRLVNRQPGTAA